MGSKTLALHRAFISKAFHSTYSRYARGVSVLISKSLLCITKTVKLDSLCRFVALVLVINNQPYTFAALYIPPPFTVGVWETVMAEVTRMAEGPIVLAGDLKAVLSSEKDRFGMETVGGSPIEACVKPYDLVEIWRWKHPDAKEYSCDSSAFNTLSRIDICFVSRELLPRVLGAQYLLRAISDHSPLLVTIDMEKPRGYVVWRLSPLWLKEECFERSTATSINNFWIEKRGGPGRDYLGCIQGHAQGIHLGID